MDRSTDARSRINLLIYGAALAGLLVSAHLWIQGQIQFERGCLGFGAGESSVFDCGAVTGSAAGTLLGVSNTIWGLLFYLAIAGSTYVLAESSESLRGRLARGRALLVTGGFGYSLYLGYVQLAVIDGLCLLCLISLGITTVLFGLVLTDWMGETSAGKSARSDRSPVWMYMAAAALLITGLDVGYFGGAARLMSGPACRLVGEGPAVTNSARLEKAAVAERSSTPAPVTVTELFDPHCPHCQELHPVMQSLAQTFADTARFTYLPIPLWKRSVQPVRALYAAGTMGRFTPMMEALFKMAETYGTVTPSLLRKAAAQAGLEADSLMSVSRSQGITRRLQRAQKTAQQAGIQSVPTVLINGHQVSERSEDCLSRLIRQEARRAGS